MTGVYQNSINGVYLSHTLFILIMVRKNFDIENKILLDGEVIDHIAKLIKEEGSDIWFEKSVKDLLPEKYKDQADKLQKGREMFDSFFDSSCSWYNLLIKNTLSLNSSQENSKGPLSDIIKDKFNTLVSDKVSESQSFLIIHILILSAPYPNILSPFNFFVPSVKSSGFKYDLTNVLDILFPDSSLINP